MGGDYMPPKLTNEIIEAAIAGFEGRKKRIDDQIAELRAMRFGVGSGVDPASTTAEPISGAKRKFSAATVQHMREAQQRRWAKAKGETAVPNTAAKPRRKISAAGRKAIAEAQRKRWAAKKAAGKP
jgi:hypothetical protein